MDISGAFFLPIPLCGIYFGTMEDFDADQALANNPFWYCDACGAQNSRLDGDCQWCDKEDTELPPGWENAPLSSQVAFLVSDGDSEVFDEIKAHLKGE